MWVDQATLQLLDRVINHPELIHHQSTTAATTLKCWLSFLDILQVIIDSAFNSGCTCSFVIWRVIEATWRSIEFLVPVPEHLRTDVCGVLLLVVFGFLEIENLKKVELEEMIKENLQATPYIKFNYRYVGGREIRHI